MYKLRSKTYLIYLLLFIGTNSVLGIKSTSKEIEEIKSTLTELNDRVFFLPENADIDFYFLQLDSIEQLCIKKKYIENRSLLAHIRSSLYVQQGYYALALNEAEKIINFSDNDYDTGIYFITLADINLNLNLLEEAYNNLIQASRLFYHDENALTMTFTRLLTLKFVQKDFKHTQDIINEIQDIASPNIDIDMLPNKSQLYHYILQIIYHIYMDMENIHIYKKQIDALSSDKKYSQLQGHNLALEFLYCYYYYTTEEYEKALSHTYNYLKECKKLKNKRWECNALLQRAQILEQLKRKKEACQDYETIVLLKDSLSIINFDRQDFILRERFQLNEFEYELWKKRQTLLKEALYYGAIAITIMFIITIVVFLANKKLQKVNDSLKIAQKKANESIYAKSLFLSNMSHEIRTPLNAITGFSDLLISQPDMDKEMRTECNNIIRQNSILLLKLLDDVLDLSNLDVQKMNFTYGNHDVIAICRSLVNMIQNIKHTDSTVIFTSPLQELTLYTDENRLRQMLINLLINATKFTKEGTITLHIELSNDNLALFSVTDTGCGIPVEKQKQVFSRFEKLNEQTSGSGLGLSICQLIIQRLGGSIWIDPSYTQGARFVFTHPITPNTKQA